MPELPDVETFRRYLNASALHQRIQSVQVEDSAILKDVSAATLRSRLEGHEFKCTRRHGKNLFVKITGREEWLRFHFGMTGYLAYFKDSKPPRHARVLFQFSNHHQLAFMDQRKLGAVGLIAAIQDYLNEKSLGPDALEISKAQFCARVSNRRGAIKAALMDQAFVAGIGNIYADELLFHSRTHPKARIENLGRGELKKNYHAMQLVLKKAIECRADIERFPRTWMLPHRRRSGKCPRCGHSWNSVRVASRTTYFCPRCQRISS